MGLINSNHNLIYIRDRFKILGLISDANGDRFTFGDIGAGDFYKSVEFGLKPFPKTPKSGYWKLNFWHNDGTSDGLPINGMTGVDGWGFFFKLEQELSDDGNAITNCLIQCRKIGQRIVEWLRRAKR